MIHVKVWTHCCIKGTIALSSFEHSGLVRVQVFHTATVKAETAGKSQSKQGELRYS